MSHLAQQDQDESVLIAVKALGDMRNGTVVLSPTLHPPSLSCAYISHHLTSTVPHILILLSSHSTHTCALCGFFIQFPNPDEPDSRFRGSYDGL